MLSLSFLMTVHLQSHYVQVGYVAVPLCAIGRCWTCWVFELLVHMIIVCGMNEQPVNYLTDDETNSIESCYVLGDLVQKVIFSLI